MFFAQRQLLHFLCISLWRQQIPSSNFLGNLENQYYSQRFLGTAASIEDFLHAARKPDSFLLNGFILSSISCPDYTNEQLAALFPSKPQSNSLRLKPELIGRSYDSFMFNAGNNNLQVLKAKWAQSWCVVLISRGTHRNWPCFKLRNLICFLG